MQKVCKSGKRVGLLLGFAVLLLWSGLPGPAVAQNEAVPPGAAPADPPGAMLPDAAPRAVESSGGRYFIEFRARSAVSYGHTFVVFGRVGAPLTRNNVAGLHPVSDSSLVYMLGHIVPVPAETGWSDGDLEAQYLIARYRVLLNEREYRRVVGYIKALQANSIVWNAATYNCNVFVQTIAHFMGMETPSPALYPKEFVNGLRTLNSKPRPARSHAQLRSGPPRLAASTAN